MRPFIAYIAVSLALLAGAVAASAATPVGLWATVEPLRGQADLASRTAWRAVTPGAALRGDLVVESGTLAAAFASRLGKVLVYSKAEPLPRKAEIRPAELLGRPVTLRATVDSSRASVKADFRTADGKSWPMAFSFSDGIVGIRPQGDTRGIGLAAPIDLAMVPSFVGEDLIYDARDYASATTLSLPSEHLLLGLLRGEASMLVAAWQEDIPSVRLTLNHTGRPGISAVSFVGGEGVSLAILDAPGIWHREALKPSMLERDVAITWTPPFPAVWLTQLLEDDVRTTFEFRDEKEETWRGGVGSYTFPTWFSHGKAMLSLGKKIPPQGDAVIYCLERNDATPRQVLTPTDIVQRTLTGDVLAGVLDVQGRTDVPVERPNAVLGGATCGVTDEFKAIFDAGQEVEKRAVIEGGVEDMYFYLERMFERNERFYPFAKDMLAYLQAQQKARTELAPYLGEMRATAEEIITTYDDAGDVIRDMNYAHQLGDQTIALAAQKRPDNPQRIVDLKQEWAGMGGALESLARREHTLTRKLYQQAGYGAAARPEALPVATEVRRRAKQCLERPEEYEIWANY